MTFNAPPMAKIKTNRKAKRNWMRLQRVASGFKNRLEAKLKRKVSDIKRENARKRLQRISRRMNRRPK